MVGEADDRTGALYFVGRAFYRQAGGFVDDAEDLSQRLVPGFVDGPAGQLFGNGVHAEDTSVGVRDDDGVANALQDSRGASFALAEFLGGVHLAGDVLADDEDSEDVAVAGEDRAVVVCPTDVLQSSVADDGDYGVFVVDGLVVVHDAFEVGADNLPGVGPALFCGFAQA